MTDCTIDAKIDLRCSIIVHGSVIEDSNMLNKPQFLLGEWSPKTVIFVKYL
jgi:hypothetical protein